MPQPLEQLRTSLADCYEIERELGRGGMATVYLARDIKHDRQVAIKVLLPDLSVALGPERFRREINLATHLSHPHILPVYDSGEANGLLYYVMPFVAGQSLRDRLNTARQLPLDEALRIACQVSGALEHAHKQGVVHRDIKPENILLEDGQALIADFGIARALSAVGDEKLTKTGISLGTPAYMSPEQAMADPHVDGRSDIYSLGCVLYEMLAGEPPFTGPTAQAVIARHALAEVPSLTVARSTIPDEVEDAVLRSMSKVPADRFATAAEFSVALQGCEQSGGRTLGRSERRGRARTKAKPVRRQTAAVGAAVAVLALAGIGWGASSYLGRPQSTVANGGLDADLKRIAVLYFRDESDAADLGYLADALTEGLIEELQPIAALDVISKNGVAQFRGKDLAPDSVAKVLKAGTIVEGTVDRVGDRIRVDVRLYDGASGIQNDKANMDRPESQLRSVRDSLPVLVARKLREQIGEEFQLKDSRLQTGNMNAWLVLQRGERTRKEARRLTLLDSAVAARIQAAAADSLFAVAETLDPAWPKPVIARAALATTQVPRTRDNAAREQLIGMGLGHVERALAIDARNAEALELRGTLRYYRRFYNLAPDPSEAATLLRTAEEDLRAATRIDPSRASAWNTLSLLLYRKFDRLGSHNAALKAFEEDAYLESTRQILERLYATSYDLENFTNARNWCEEVNRRYPTDAKTATCRLWLTTTTPKPRFDSTDVAAAWKALDEVRARMPATQWEAERRLHQMLVAVPIARAGLRDSANHVIEAARASRAEDPTGELIGREVLVRTLIGDKDKALELLGPYLAAFPQHREGFINGNTWWWRPIQDDPRFKALVGS